MELVQPTVAGGRLPQDSGCWRAAPPLACRFLDRGFIFSASPAASVPFRLPVGWFCLGCRRGCPECWL